MDLIKLKGANMDIDLTSNNLDWNQEECPWNKSENTKEHKCAVKNISICDYFCGVEYMDTVVCCYPNRNPNRTIE